jgi:hypothetical protein
MSDSLRCVVGGDAALRLLVLPGGGRRLLAAKYPACGARRTIVTLWAGTP